MKAEQHHPLRMRTLFYLQTCEKVTHLIPNAVLAEDLIPLAGPYLRAKTSEPALFDTSHSLLMAVSSAGEKEVAVEVGPYYAKLLLEVS